LVNRCAATTTSACRCQCHDECKCEIFNDGSYVCIHYVSAVLLVLRCVLNTLFGKMHRYVRELVHFICSAGDDMHVNHQEV